MLINKFKAAAAGCAVLSVLSALPLTASAETVVVVSSKSQVGTITKDQAADIFLGKATTFPGGGQAVPVNQAEGAAVRDDFYMKVTGKSGAQLKAYWTKIIFTGKGQPPKDVPDSASVKKLVADNPNIVGYIDKGAVDGSVKVVLSLQ
jgi:ABC-type phosphate transport system substrate-binding protein